MTKDNWQVCSCVYLCFTFTRLVIWRQLHSATFTEGQNHRTLWQESSREKKTRKEVGGRLSHVSGRSQKRTDDHNLQPEIDEETNPDVRHESTMSFSQPD